MDAIEIRLGEGRVLVGHFIDVEGRGLVFWDTGEEHKVGEWVGEVGEEVHYPQPGEVYLKCLTLESAKVLREMVDEMCERFQSDEGKDGGEDEL